MRSWKVSVMIEAINLYDKNNVPRFRAGEPNKYLCNMCGQYTTLSESVSHRGFNLVCNHCFYKMRAILGNDNLLKDIQDVGREKEANSL